jgi:hypothetical protein
LYNSEYGQDYLKGQESYQKNQDEVRGNSSNQGKYYWMAVVRKGKVVILGYRLSEAEAWDYIMTNCSGEAGEVHAYDTKDIHKVSGHLKSVVLEKYHDISKATERMVLNQSEQMKIKKERKKLERPKKSERDTFLDYGI